MNGILTDYLDRLQYVSPDPEREKAVAKAEAEVLKEMSDSRGFIVLKNTADELLGEMHQRMLNGQETPEFYKGFYRAITAIFAYPDDRIKQALRLLEQTTSEKGKEDENEY